MDEDDGYDETLVPVDYGSAGQIRDDDLYDNLVCAVPSGASLVALMDCCHSGSVLDLPYKYRATPYSNTLACLLLFVLVLVAVIYLPIAFA